jgi:hypothetical protein
MRIKCNLENSFYKLHVLEHMTEHVARVTEKLTWIQSLRKPEGLMSFEDLGMDEKLILKWVLKK